MDLEDIIPVGEPAITGDGCIEAVVVAIAIYGGPRVQYQLAWFDGNVRRIEWVESFEVKPKGTTRTTIGFLKGATHGVS